MSAHPNQFALLGQRRFAPFFWTQFLGAANDNLFKFGFTVLVTYQLHLQWLQPEMAGLVIGALFDRIAAHDRPAMFALGWLAHERDSAINRCVAALQALRKAPVFW